MSYLKRRNRSDDTATLIFAIILIVLGGGTFLQYKFDIPVWSHIWKFWPVLLIIMGVKILLDHYHKKQVSSGE